MDGHGDTLAESQNRSSGIVYNARSHTGLPRRSRPGENHHSPPQPSSHEETGGYKTPAEVGLSNPRAMAIRRGGGILQADPRPSYLPARYSAKCQSYNGISRKQHARMVHAASPSLGPSTSPAAEGQRSD